MLKRIIVASALAVLSIGPAGRAQSFGTRQLAGVSPPPGLFASVQACEAQKRRVAGSVKTLAFNYNAERVHNECVASAREAVVSKEFSGVKAASHKFDNRRRKIEHSGLGVPIDLVYLDVGGTVAELITYEGASVEPAPQKEHLGYRMIALEVDDMAKTTAYLEAEKGGHFAAWEQPKIFAAELRAAFRPLREPNQRSAGRTWPVSGLLDVGRDLWRT